MGKYTSAKAVERSRHETHMEDRRRKVSEYHLEGKTQQQIADILGVGQATVARDIKAIRTAWTKEYADVYDNLVARELATLDREIRKLETLRNAYEEKRTEDGGYSGATIDALLAISDRMHRIGEHRRKVLGIGGVNKIAFTDPSGQENVFSDDWREQLIARLVQEKNDDDSTTESDDDA